MAGLGIMEYLGIVSGLSLSPTAAKSSSSFLYVAAALPADAQHDIGGEELDHYLPAAARHHLALPQGPRAPRVGLGPRARHEGPITLIVLGVTCRAGHYGGTKSAMKIYCCGAC